MGNSTDETLLNPKVREAAHIYPPILRYGNKTSRFPLLKVRQNSFSSEKLQYRNGTFTRECEEDKEDLSPYLIPSVSCSVAESTSRTRHL